MRRVGESLRRGPGPAACPGRTRGRGCRPPSSSGRPAPRRPRTCHDDGLHALTPRAAHCIKPGMERRAGGGHARGVVAGRAAGVVRGLGARSALVAAHTVGADKGVAKLPRPRTVVSARLAHSTAILVAMQTRFPVETAKGACTSTGGPGPSCRRHRPAPRRPRAAARRRRAAPGARPRGSRSTRGRRWSTGRRTCWERLQAKG